MYPEIFVSANIFLRMRKFSRPHAAYSNRFQQMPSPFVAVSLFTNLFLATRETVFRITINGALKGHEDLSV